MHHARPAAAHPARPAVEQHSAACYAGHVAASVPRAARPDSGAGRRTYQLSAGQTNRQPARLNARVALPRRDDREQLRSVLGYPVLDVHGVPSDPAAIAESRRSVSGVSRPGSRGVPPARQMIVVGGITVVALAGANLRDDLRC